MSRIPAVITITKIGVIQSQYHTAQPLRLYQHVWYVLGGKLVCCVNEIAALSVVIAFALGLNGHFGRGELYIEIQAKFRLQNYHISTGNLAAFLRS